MLAAAVSNGLESLESRRLMTAGPLANASGPYVVNEGSQIVLDGSASSGATGYKWDLNYDGSFSTTVTGKKFTYNAADNFPGGGPRTIALRVTDADGHTNTVTSTLTINDVAPTVTLTGDSSVDEGESYALAWSSTDPGKDTISSWIIDWNDGTSPQTFAGSVKNATHVFNDAGSFTISMTAVDEDGSHGPTTKSVTVNNVGPEVTATGAATINEGSPYTVNFSATKDEIDTWVVDWGDDEIEVFNDADISSATHTYADNGNRVITITAVSTDGDTGEDTINVSVQNVAPTVEEEGTPDASVTEGTAITHSLTVNDPGADTFTYAWSVKKGNQVYTLPGNVVTNASTFTWTPTDNGAFVVSVTVTDDDGGEVVHHTKSIEVTNVDPTGTITRTGSGSVVEGTAVTLTANPADAGASDTFTYLWGVTKDGLPYQLPGSIPNDGQTFTFTPRNNGEYIAHVMITDDDGGEISVASTVVIATNAAPTATIDGLPVAQPVVVDLAAADFAYFEEDDGDVTRSKPTEASIYHNSYYEMSGYAVLTFALPQGLTADAVSAATLQFNNYSQYGDVDPVNIYTWDSTDSAVTDGDAADAFGASTLVATDVMAGMSGRKMISSAGVADAIKAALSAGRDNVAFAFRYVDYSTASDGGTTVATPAHSQSEAHPKLSITTAAPVTANEGDHLNLSAGVTDAGADDTHTYQWSVEKLESVQTGGLELTNGKVEFASPTLTDQMTIAFWINSDSSDKILFSTESGLGTDGVTLSIQEGELSYTHQGGGGGRQLSLQDGWNHIATTIDFASGEIRVKINGAGGGANTGHSWSKGSGLAIGSLVGGAGTFTGGLDDIRVYTSILSDQDISLLAAEGLPTASARERFDFEEGTGTSVVSTGSDATSATLTNAVWGDGVGTSSTTTTLTLPQGTVTNGENFQFVPQDNGTYRVKLTVTDSDHAAVSTQTSDIVVSNVAPDAALADGAPATGAEGSPLTFNSASTDAGPVDALSLTYAWSVTKDNGPFVLPPSTVIDAASFTFTPTDDGTYVVTLNVTDKDGASDVVSKSVVVANVDPEAEITSAPTTHVNEGSTVSLGSSVTDAGADDSVASYAWTVTKDDETYELPNGILTNASTFSFVPGDNGEYVVKLVVTDGDGGTGETTATIHVDNVDPTAVLSGEPGTPINEGAPVTLSVVGNDVAADVLSYAWSVTKNDVVFALPSNTITNAASFTFTPTDDGEYVASVVVSDEDGGSVTKTSTTITVNNAPPAVTVVAPSEGVEGSEIAVGSIVTDSGQDDTHTYQWSVEKLAGTGGGTGTMGMVYDDDLGGGSWAINSFAIPTSYTVAMRIKLTPGMPYSDVINLNNGGNETLLRIFKDLDTGDYELMLSTWNNGQSGSLYKTVSAETLEDDFALIAFSWDGQSKAANLYVNDMESPTSATFADGMPSGAGYVYANHVNGEYDSLAIYDDVLDSADLASLANNEGASIGPIDAWGFGEAPGATVAASTGTRHTNIQVTDSTFSGVASWQAFTLPDDVALDGESLNFVPTDNGTYRVTLVVTDNDGLSGTATSHEILVSNVAPTATIDGASTADEGDEVSLSADVDDAGTDDTFSYAWSVKKNNVNYGSAGSSSTYAFTPADDGSYVVSLTVTDDDGGTVTTTKTIVVNNVAPEGDITGVPTSAVNEGTAITLGNDAGDVAADTLSYAWSVKKGNAAYTLPNGVVTNAADFTFTPRDNGTYTVTLVVSDEDGGEIERTASITVNNVDPTATVSGAPTGDAYEGESVTLTATPADAGSDDTFTYGWSVKKNNVAYTLPQGVTANAAAFTFTPNDNGAYVATVVVTDDDGGTVSKTSSFVILNVAPEASIVGAPETANEGDTISVSAEVTDAGAADTHTYQWSVEKADVDGDLDLDVDTESATFSFVPADNGTYRIKLTVTDKDGSHVSTQTETIVVSNVRPTVTVSGASTSVEGSQVSLTSSAHDAGANDTLTYAWTVTKNDQSVTLPQGTVTNAAGFAFTPVDNGDYVVTLIVTDKDGATSLAASHVLSVTNANPTATIVATGAAVEASPMTFTATASDAGVLDTFTYAWSVKKDGQAYTLANGTVVNAAAFTFTPNDNGSYVATCVVTDKDGGAATVTKTVAIANVAPTGVLSAAPNNAVEGGTVSFTATATDPAGNQDTISYAWSVTRGGNAFTLPSSVVKDAANFSFVATDNGSYVVTCVVSDEDGGSTGVHSSAFSVANVAPTMTLTGGTNAAVRNRDVSFAAAVTDAGSEDTLSYAWDFGDGFKLKGGTARTHAYVTPGTYTVTMTATDKDGASVTKTQAVTVNVAATMADPVDADKQALVIGGTEAADTVKLSAVSANRIKLYVNTVLIGTFTVTGNIYAYLGDGDNYLKTEQDVTRPVFAFAGNGRDTLIGGAAADVLVGGTGNDAIFGWAGNDVLIGGENADSLEGEAGDDLLVSGTTAHDADANKLAAISREWSRTDLSYATRIAHVRGTSSGGLNGSSILASTTVFSDTSIDRLNGGENRDWLFATTTGSTTIRDTLVGQDSTDTLN